VPLLVIVPDDGEVQEHPDLIRFYPVQYTGGKSWFIPSRVIARTSQGVPDRQMPLMTVPIRHMAAG